MQIAEQQILVVCASLVVHCCAAKKNAIVASQLYGVGDVQFTVEYRPVATGGIRGQCPPNLFCFPPNFLVSRNICFKNIIKTKFLPP